jgi:integrase
MPKPSSTLLTKRIIDGIASTDKRYELWDSQVSGFGLRVGISGVKTFVIRYRADGGGRNAPRRYVTVGRYGALTVEQARKKAQQLLAAVTVGEDPARERDAKRNEMRISELIDLYEKEGCFIQRGIRQGEPMKERTKAYTVGRLRHHVVTLLGTKRVSEVQVGEVERFFRDVEAGKSASDTKLGKRRRIIVRGGEGAARKVFRDLSAVFSFASRRGLIATNPCEKAVVRKTDNRRERFLSTVEIKQLGEALNALEADGINKKALDITRLWVLTGCRRQEIAELKWSEIDFDRGLLVLADTKTGRSVRPLASVATALLEMIQRVEGSEYVFPADSGDGYFQGTKKIWPKIVQKADLEGVTPHTLRHTMGAMATSSGEALALTGAILGHANMRSTMIYAHVEMDPSKKAADRVGERLANSLYGHSELLLEDGGSAIEHGRASTTAFRAPRKIGLP